MIIDYVTHTITTWQRNDKASLREEQKGGGEGRGDVESRENQGWALLRKKESNRATLFPTKNIYKEILSF
jgi:hypothetical protein